MITRSTISSPSLLKQQPVNLAGAPVPGLTHSEVSLRGKTRLNAPGWCIYGELVLTEHHHPASIVDILMSLVLVLAVHARR
jgi:hypothetical protein